MNSLMKTMTFDELKPALIVHIIEHIANGYFMDPEEDDEGLNHDELQGLIENFCDDNNFDPYENDLSYRTLADEYERLIYSHYYPE